MINYLKNIVFVICLSVLISKNVYTPVLVNTDILGEQTTIVEIA